MNGRLGILEEGIPEEGPVDQGLLLLRVHP